MCFHYPSLSPAPGFEKPSAIQQRGIVPFAKGLDVIQQAQSGTGKTATFCSGVLQQLDYNLLECQALVLAPTRELAQQIEKVMRALGDYLQVRGRRGGNVSQGTRRCIRFQNEFGMVLGGFLSVVPPNWPYRLNFSPLCGSRMPSMCVSNAHAFEVDRSDLHVGSLQVKVHACVGGTSVREDQRILQAGVHVVVGTPGRVYDMLRRHSLRPDSIKCFVLDEADEMLSRGFKDQVREKGGMGN